jgi:two-component sensor histidine kinase
VQLRQKAVSIRRQKVLTEECHHRLLNNLQMIVALLSLQSQRETNAETASRLSTAADRVQAIAGLHRHLHSMDGTPTVDFKPYLDRLCRDHSTMSMSEERPDQLLAVDAIELSLPTTIGIPLSLIVNELITNAIKHGRGRITVRLAPSGKGHALSVSNDGVNLPEDFDPTASKGLGMTLVSSLVRQIGGKLRIDRGGEGDCTRFTVLFA